MTIKDIAKSLKMSEQMVRECIKAGKFPFAVALNVTGRRFKYIIFEEKFLAWIRS